MIRLESLGRCTIMVGETRIVPTAPAIFASALYFAVEGARPIDRRHMAELLWPALDQERAAHSLRQALYRLRALGAPVAAEGERLTLRRDDVVTDFGTWLEPGAACAPEDVLARIPGGFLPSYFPTISGPFATWVELQRDRVNAALRRQLVSAIAALRARADWAATQAVAQRCLDIDPLNEEATLALAEGVAMQGSKARAIHLLDRYRAEIGPLAPDVALPATVLRKRITELYALPPNVERDPPLIGRQREMDTLTTALEHARRGRGRAILVTGPAGIGKSRLVSELVRSAQLRGISVASAYLGPHDRRRSLGVWSDLVPALLAMPGALGCDPASLPFLGRLTSPDTATVRDAPEGRDAEYLLARVRGAALDLVAAVASESCVLLAIDDVQWIDEESWGIVAALASRISRMGALVVMTRRDAETDAAEIPEEAELVELPMTPLDPGARRLLLEAIRTPDETWREDFVEWCARTSAGNPLFLIELGRRATRTSGEFLAPPSLTRLIARRFERLTDVSRRALQAAAILGRHSTPTRIERVLAERRLSTLDALDELARHALIVLDAGSARCAHDLLGSAVLDSLTPPSARLLRAHAAAVLEEESDERSSLSYLWDCAHLWREAGESGRAWRMLERCASRSFQVGDIRAAVRVLEEMRQHGDAPAGELDHVRARLVRTYHVLRDHQHVVQVASEIRRALAGDGAGPLGHSDAELFELEARMRLSGEKEQLVHRCLECVLDVAADPAHRVEAASQLTKHANDTFDADSAHRANVAVAPLLERVAPVAAATYRMFFEASFGSPPAGAAAARALLRLSADAGDLAYGLTLETQCSQALFMNGDIEECFALGRSAFERAIKLEMFAQARSMMEQVEQSYLALGDVEQARILHDAAIGPESAEHRPETFTRIEHRARRLLLEGDGEAAAPWIKQLLASSPRLWGRGVVHIRGLEFLTRMLAEDHAPSDEEMTEMVRLHHLGRAHGIHDLFMYVLVVAYARRGEQSIARQTYSEYLSRHRRDGAPILEQLAAFMRH